jgi:hypothetical protein
MRKFATIAIITLGFILLAYLLLSTGVLSMTSKTAFTIEEPLLIEGEQQKTYSLLPAGSVLYLDKSWPEGHQTFHVYFHFKGNFKAAPADPKSISPLWLRTVDREELPKLLSEYPLSKQELTALLRARSVTKAELTQILREWPEEQSTPNP